MLCVPPLYAVSFGRTERLRPVQNGSALNSQHELVDDSLFVPVCVLVLMGWLDVLRESPFATVPSPVWIQIESWSVSSSEHVGECASACVCGVCLWGHTWGTVCHANVQVGDPTTKALRLDTVRTTGRVTQQSAGWQRDWVSDCA